MKGIGRQSFLVVFDFDHTVMDCNTDEVIPDALGRHDEQRKMVMEKDRMQWTKLMDTLIAPFSKDELTAAAHKSVVIDPQMPDVFHYLLDAQKQYAAPEMVADAADARATAVHDNIPNFLEINIASDANLLFIDAALDARLPFVKESISQIHSNPYYDLTALGVDADAGLSVCYGENRPAKSTNVNDETERDATYNAGRPRKSRVCWYEPHGHQCECCMANGKPNMCKSLIIERLLQTTTLIDPTIIFVGDGTNDYCPIANLLRPRDYMFARRNFPIHHILCGAAKHPAGANDVAGCCHIGLWKDAKELKELFQLALEHPGARLPTLARFRDVSAKEFRSVTMAKRIPSVLKRTLEESGNMAVTSAKGQQRVRELILNAEKNGFVPPVPGQAHVAAWLRNFAYVTEYDHDPAHDVARRVSAAVDGTPADIITPRWGQLPWLHGEIYFYHLLWQYLMLREDEVAGDADAASVKPLNVITPHAFQNPLYSQECQIATTPGIISPPVIPQQGVREYTPLTCNPALIADGVVVRRVHAHAKQGAAAKQVPYADLLRQPSGCVLPPVSDFFLPYRDIFAQEKRDVLVQFIHVRVVPMLACQPWHAGSGYGGVLLRWMLWGNGIDLSMFTLDQLTHAHVREEREKDSHDSEVALLQDREKVASLAQDANLVGNEVAQVEAHLQRLLDPADPCNGTRQIDIVNDNVGVEVISDLCFGLWYVEQMAKLGDAGKSGRVVYHVKPMPYYVSDVTPRDFDLTLKKLEAAYTNSDFEPDAAKRATLKSAVEPFVRRVRDCFASGRFAVEADTVWTQPSEYRDLPPRVVNRYFYTQHVSTPAASKDVAAALAATGSPTSPQGLYCMNKTKIHARSGLVLFKGDLNFRRLVGDRYWDRSDFVATLAPTEKADLHKVPEGYSAEVKALIAELTQDTPASALMDTPSFHDVISAYWPSHAVPVCAIRTIKSECCVGVPGDVKAKLDQELGIGWRVTGKYGEILFSA
ncbi:putative Phosphatase/Damage-control phosphatase ARMT1-like domain containing protein [Lotmaria passim]